MAWVSVSVTWRLFSAVCLPRLPSPPFDFRFQASSRTSFPSTTFPNVRPRDGKRSLTTRYSMEHQRLIVHDNGASPPLAPEATLQPRGKRKLPPNPDAGSTVRGAFPRKRAFVACQLCRTRKTKCDNQRPTCGTCEQIGSTCQYPDQTFGHAS